MGLQRLPRPLRDRLRVLSEYGIVEEQGEDLHSLTPFSRFSACFFFRSAARLILASSAVSVKIPSFSPSSPSSPSSGSLPSATSFSSSFAFSSLINLSVSATPRAGGLRARDWRGTSGSRPVGLR